MNDNTSGSQEHQTVFIPETFSADFYVDVRSEKEFANGHISNAINLPILNDLERHEVGWLYKNASVEEAKMRGAMYGGSKIEQFVRTVSAIKNSFDSRNPSLDTPEHSTGRIVIYCARGGYRSKSVVALLNSIGIPVLQLEGGYKAYRQYVLSRLKGPFPRFIGINGLTGSGKTYILHELDHLGEPTLDLEGAANHKGSTLGAIGTDKIQCVQQFENDLVSQLDKAENRIRTRNLPPYCFIEMESRRIGKLTIPAPLYAAYHDEAQQIYIERTREQRVEHLLFDYTEVDPAVFLQEVSTALERIKAYVTPQAYQAMRDAFSKKNHRELAGLLLDHHYDPQYRRSIGDPSYLACFGGSSYAEIASQVVSWIRSNPPALSRLF